MSAVTTPTFRMLLALALGILSTGCSRNHQAEQESTIKTNQAQEVLDEGCPHQKDGSCDQVAPPEADKHDNEGGPQKYGEPLGQSPVVTLAQLVATPDAFHEKTVRVEGYVRRVCAKKGCWMEVSDGDSPQATGFRVTFKDYGFLVPVDSKGKKAKLEGLVQITKVKKEAVDHYEAEGAHFPGKAPDGTAREVRLVATGVELSQS
jgi:hypothetical protein